MIPQIILFAIWMISLGANIAKHGQDQELTYNGWHKVIIIIIQAAFLYWGGWFD